MDYTFKNGTARQKQLWGEAAHQLLNYAFDDIPLQVDVEFVDSGEVTNHGHTSLAITTASYGSSGSTTIVRNDAPSFGTAAQAGAAAAAGMGLSYSVERFYLETAIHELGHSAFNALTQPVRLAVVKLFSPRLKSDDPALLAPPNTPWEDHIAEGIAETFKEAFLPARFRVFPNRTNRRISYSKFPLFRALFRGEGEGGGGGFSYAYFSDDYRVDLSEWGLTEGPYHQSDRDDEAFVFWDEAKCKGFDMSQFPESGEMPYKIEEEEEGGAS